MPNTKYVLSPQSFLDHSDDEYNQTFVWRNYHGLDADIEDYGGVYNIYGDGDQTLFGYDFPKEKTALIEYFVEAHNTRTRPVCIVQTLPDL